jgi:Cft2 family RNA processing exonuclease
MLTGWAVDPSARYRYGVHEMIALSDHADFPELVEYVERARPKVVYTLHGGPGFAHHLRDQGIEAHHLAD